MASDTIKFKKLDPRATVPQYKSAGAAGLDLYALEDFEVWSGDMIRVRTGLAWAAPWFVAGRIVPRSSMFAKGFDCDGTIDSDYRGEILVQLRYFSHEERTYHGKAGERIAQLIPVDVSRLPIEVVEELDETERGAGGFGSTGK